MRRQDCHERIRQVKGNYRTALQTVSVLIDIVQERPDIIHKHALDLRAMRALAQELHDIYFTRMFACFESSLRYYWRTSVRNTKPSTEQLISSVAGRLAVPRDSLDMVQEIRCFRNYLIHEQQEEPRRFSMDEASGHLNTFLARLPLEW